MFIITVPSPPVTVQKTICGSTQSCSPEDGHNGARNMLTEAALGIRGA